MVGARGVVMIDIFFENAVKGLGGGSDDRVLEQIGRFGEERTVEGTVDFGEGRGEVGGDCRHEEEEGPHFAYAGMGTCSSGAAVQCSWLLLQTPFQDSGNDLCFRRVGSQRDSPSSLPVRDFIILDGRASLTWGTRSQFGFRPE